jgi:D-alanyl-D-alanine carboxypeptidase
MRYALLAGVLLVLVWGLPAQSFNPSKLDSFFHDLEKAGKGMGSISLFQNGKEVYRKSIGFADVKRHIKPTANTKYRIGSITKTFTATVIMQLVDEKALTLDTKLSQFFPKIPNAGQISIAQLLGHRSGLDDNRYLTWEYYGKTFKLAKKPVYANCNYILLSQIAEKIEGKKFADILAARIFIPCQLRNTYYGNKADSIHDEALSYRYLRDLTVVPPNDLDESAGAGAIVSTPTDLNAFLYQLFVGKLVSPTALEEMKKMVSGYGFGMMQVSFYDKTAFSHSGGIDAFQSTAAFFPKENFSIVYISNGAKMPLNDILITVLKIYFAID